MEVPQSNQRGIETAAPSSREKARPWRPQSNQRGIETDVGEDLGDRQVDASIEPAWD